MHSDSNDHDDFDELQGWLEDQDGSGAELWDPQVDETLVGTFLRYEQRYSPKIGGECKVAIIEDRAQQLHAVWLSRSVLASAYERENPEPGDGMGHKYHGMKQPRGAGQAYHNYTVRKLRAPGGHPPPTPVSPPSSTPPSAPTPTAVPAPAATAPGARSDDDIPF
jgi:hypothetical protein